MLTASDTRTCAENASGEPAAPLRTERSALGADPVRFPPRPEAASMAPWNREGRPIDPIAQRQQDRVAAPPDWPCARASPQAGHVRTVPRPAALVLVLVIVCGQLLAALARGAPPSGPDAPAAEVELEPVQVLGQRPPPDPFAFRNPVEVEGTVFSRHWDEPPSIEEVGLRGGYVQLAINRGLEAIASGVRRLPGWKQVTPAQARPPPPLDGDQAGRARRLYEGTDPPTPR